MGDVASIEKISGLFGIAGPLGEVNIGTVIHTWMVISFIIAFSLLVRFRLKAIPDRLQAFAEVYVKAFDTLVRDTLEFEVIAKNRRYLPLIATLFIFVFLSNISGFFPFMEEPTSDLNTTLGLGIMGFFIATGSSIFFKGIWGFFKEMYLTIEAEGFIKWIINFPFFLLNIIGEFGKVASISFRLFGNIKGGTIIFMVVTWLIKYFVLPLPMILYFGFFAGTVQAFVFTMLTLTYIAVAVK